MKIRDEHLYHGTILKVEQGTQALHGRLNPVIHCYAALKSG